MNWLDQTVGFFSPRAGLRRARARAAMNILRRGYEGAKVGRRTEGWRAPGSGASACSSWPTFSRVGGGGGGNPPEILTAKGNHFIRPSGKKAHLGLDQVARIRHQVQHHRWNSEFEDGILSKIRKGLCIQRATPSKTDFRSRSNRKLIGMTLNPPFVEVLMGWPTGWTGFDSVGTEGCCRLRRMRGELLNLDSVRLETEAA